MNDEIRNLTLRTSDSNTLKRAASELGMVSLREDGISKVFDGLTTVEEVFIKGEKGLLKAVITTPNAIATVASYMGGVASG